MDTLLSMTGGLIFLAMVFLIQPTIIYCLWDDVMVKFFGLQDVSFTDSLWISILFSVLFKNATTSSKD